jgi:hypothetical protein
MRLAYRLECRLARRLSAELNGGTLLCRRGVWAKLVNLPGSVVPPM